MRDVKRSIDAYNKMVEKEKGTGASFFFQDMKQLEEMSPTKYDLMVNSLYFGFMVGYRRAKAEMKERERKEKKQ